MYWYSNLTNLIWIRNHVMAPLSEEFTYRSCILPLLLQNFSPFTAILISPLFFGVGEKIPQIKKKKFITTNLFLAHFHHMWERIHHMKMSFNLALKISCKYNFF